jgi:WD40 repeat protein
VCESCGADWTTCPEPTGREVRLGRTARLRDVEPGGRIGLVTKWFGSMRAFDLRRLRWVDEMLRPDDVVLPALPESMSLVAPGTINPVNTTPRRTELPAQRRVRAGQILERLSPTGEVYCARYRAAGDDTGSFFEFLDRRSLVTGVWTQIATSHEPLTSTGMTKDGHYYYVSAEQRVVVVAPDTTVRTFEPLPRRVVQACHVNMETKILASAGWGEVVLHEIDGDAINRTGGVRTSGNCTWVKFEEPWLAACVEGELIVWHVAENLSVGRKQFLHTVGGPVYAADLSRDGRYLAFAAKRKVILHDLDQDLVVEYDDHTDDICLVRFVGLDQMLVTADEDNRVVLRPRTPEGYVRSVIDIAIPDKPIALELDDEIDGR